MSDKMYRLGLIVGRFQMLHAGHEDMIGRAIALCDRVCVFVGSSQESGTRNNPFDYQTRHDMLYRVFGETIDIHPLPDKGIGNNSSWGEYLMSHTWDIYHAYPDLHITGKESRHLDWFSGLKGVLIAELFIPKAVEISASEMRQHLLDNDEAAWKKMVNPALYPMYEHLRRQIVASWENTNTQSI